MSALFLSPSLPREVVAILGIGGTTGASEIMVLSPMGHRDIELIERTSAEPIMVCDALLAKVAV
jgi:hypothetical protein